MAVPARKLTFAVGKVPVLKRKHQEDSGKEGPRSSKRVWITVESESE